MKRAKQRKFRAPVTEWFVVCESSSPEDLKKFYELAQKTTRFATYENFRFYPAVPL